MTTLDSDIIRISTSVFGEKNFRLIDLDLEWPPPEYLYLASDGSIREATPADDKAFVLKRVSMSQLDDETARHPNLARGASYSYLTRREIDELDLTSTLDSVR